MPFGEIMLRPRRLRLQLQRLGSTACASPQGLGHGTKVAQTSTLCGTRAYVRFGSSADIAAALPNVRFTLESGPKILAVSAKCQYATGQIYSITSSARSRNASGIARPSPLAVVRLMTISNLVGCWIFRFQ
jgi:hypothetical protein